MTWVCCKREKAREASIRYFEHVVKREDDAPNDTETDMPEEVRTTEDRVKGCDYALHWDTEFGEGDKSAWETERLTQQKCENNVIRGSPTPGAYGWLQLCIWS